mmetsp:Transcript_103340/g.179297  ORF Transcript_103340/g.179297 Transcript_103340/m.179297 type:complete len:202 (-) Transcript_103340:574-1179(-)
MTLLTIVVKQWLRNVPLHNIGSLGLRQVHAFLWMLATLNAGAPVTVRLLDKPRHGLHVSTLWRWGFADPLPVHDDVCGGHQIWHKFVKLPLVFEPNPPFDVHCYPAKVRLIRKIHTPSSKWAVAHLALPILKPLLTWIHPPVWALQQVQAEALSMASDFAIRAVEVLPLGLWKDLFTLCQCAGKPNDYRPITAGYVIDGLA